MNFWGEYVDLDRPAVAHISARAIAARSLLLAAAVSIGGISASADAPAPELPRITRSHIETDGMLTARDARRIARATAARRAASQDATDTSSIWLFDYVSRMLGDEPAVAKRPRRAARIAIATSAPLAAGSVAPVTQQRPAAAVPTATASTSVLTSPIVTGGIAPGRAQQPLPTPESPDAIIVAAERTQTRLDLVKLELASRTYDERKMSGQQVFELRSDWRVLERAQDALSGAELIAATAAGFEANAYINEATRTIIVAVAGSQDLRRDFLTADVWKALIKAEAPQQFYLAKTYVRSVIQRYQLQGYSTECVGHSLGGGACAYAAAELGIRALVLNPISAGKLPAAARVLVTNYIVDGEIASLVYGARGNEFPGHVQVISDGRDVIRLMALEKFGQMAGPILVIREFRASVQAHKVDHALDLIATQAETARPR